MGGVLLKWLVVGALTNGAGGPGFKTQLAHRNFQKLSLFTQQ